MKKILIVEDDDNIRELLRLYLEREGYQVSEAENGAAGLSKWKAEDPDMMLLDVMMPVMDGWQVCKEVRAADQSMPIIMITAKGETMDKVSGLELGADDYIVKPLEMREVIARVRAVFRRFAGDDSGSWFLTNSPLISKLMTLSLMANGLTPHPKKLNCSIIWHKAPTGFLPVYSCWMMCGGLIIMAIPAPLMSMLNACAKNWKAFRINGN